MASNDEKHATFNQIMARLHAREQKLAADLNQLDKEIQQFRRDTIAFHARRAYVHALMQQEAEDEIQYRLAEEYAVKTSTQTVAAPGSRMQAVAAEPIDRDAKSVDVGTAPGTAPDQNVNPVVDDGDSLFVPEQARSEEHNKALTSRPKRRVTFADDADVIVNRNASSGPEERSGNAQNSDDAQSNDNASVALKNPSDGPKERHGS